MRPPAQPPSSTGARVATESAIPTDLRARRAHHGLRGIAPPGSLVVQQPERQQMAIGPVQLIVLGFTEPEFHGEIIAELERLHDEDTVRVIDALAVHKDADGEIEVVHLSNLSKDEAIELGTKVGALVGIGLMSAEEAYELHASETAGAVS